jgi:hypothetical protein
MALTDRSISQSVNYVLTEFDALVIQWIITGKIRSYGVNLGAVYFCKFFRLYDYNGRGGRINDKLSSNYTLSSNAF